MAKEIEIGIADVENIMGENFSHFPMLEKNCFCSYCGDSKGNNTTEIIDYTITLNDLYDVILFGKCKKCAKPVTRYIETGEVEESRERAKSIVKRKSFKII